MKEKTNKKLMIITGCALTVAAIASALLWLFVFSADTPAKQFRNVKSSDIESISGESLFPTAKGELTGENIDEFIRLMKDADYKRSDRTEHWSNPVVFTVKYKDGKEQTIEVRGSYESDNTLFKGFVKIDDGDYYECDTKELRELFFKNSDSKYKE